MIRLDKTKITIDGIDVYPDHADDYQFWMVPGTVHLSERDKQKVLSYIWYIDSATDPSGSGFLNFEVNTAVSDETQSKIASALASAFRLDAPKIRLAMPTYNSGSVNFSVLGPLAAASKVEKGASSVVYSDKDQVVWHAGSSSLVGDNTAVCSVKFTKEGGLAPLVYEALREKKSVIAASYALEFTGLRPSVSFKVSGKLEKTIDQFKVSIGAGVPLEVFMLDVGLASEFQRVMQKTGLKIDVIDYGGSDNKGREWAQKIVMDHLLKNFFEVQIAPGSNNWNPLKDEPKVDSAVRRSSEISSQSDEKSKKDGLDPEKDVEKIKENAQKAVKAAMPELPLPKVNIRASYYRGTQTNELDFQYTEMAAQSYPIAPQSLLSLGKNDKVSDYVMQVNRSTISFGLPRPASVVAPNPEAAKAIGLQAITINARYPDRGDAAQRQTLTIQNGQVTVGQNPMPFQYNAAGDVDVAYEAQYIFDPSSNWTAAKTEYSVKATTATTINVMPGAFLGFTKLDVALAPNFVWHDTDQAIVSIEGGGSSEPVTVVIQKGETNTKSVQLRTESPNPSLTYKIDLTYQNRPVHSSGPYDVNSSLVRVLDQFEGRYMIQLLNQLKTADMAVVSVQYKDGDFMWESEQIQIERGSKPAAIVVPTPNANKPKDQVELSYTVMTSEGTYTKQIKANAAIFVTDK
jgi:hypothetical protein